MWCADRNVGEQSDGGEYSASMQPPKSPLGVQQQFAFAAGLAAAEDVPLATPDPAEATQPSRANSMTEPQQLPAQQQQWQDEEDKQSTQSASQASPESSTGQLNRLLDGQTDGQTGGQTDGQTDRQADRQTDGLADRQPDGQTFIAKGQLPADRKQQPELNSEERNSWCQPDERDRIKTQHDTEVDTVAEGTGSNAFGSSQNSSTTFGDDSSSSEGEVVDIEQMNFGERLQAGIDCFR